MAVSNNLITKFTWVEKWSGVWLMLNDWNRFSGAWNKGQKDEDKEI